MKQKKYNEYIFKKKEIKEKFPEVKGIIDAVNYSRYSGIMIIRTESK